MQQTPPTKDAWRSRSVLVTGGAGFIGSHLVESLLELGATVRVLGKYNSRSDRGFLQENAHPSLEVVLGDVADLSFTSGAAEGVDTIFHLAALIGIPYSYLAPMHYVDTNVGGTVSVLEAARRHGVRRVVHTSTSETYGSAQYTPIDELHPLVGQSPYSATKIAADKLAESYHRSFDLPVVTLRPFNTFGPRQSMRAVIPTIASQALFADTIEVGSLDPVRDMNFVADTVAAFLAVGAAEGVEGEVFNVGSGIGHSIGEILDEIQALTGTDKPVTTASQRVRPPASEVETLICDYSKATEAFGYKPSVSLTEGLKLVTDWIRQEGAEARISEYRI